MAEGTFTFSGLAPTFLSIFFMYSSHFKGVTMSVPSCIFVISKNSHECSECDFYINAPYSISALETSDNSMYISFLEAIEPSH